MADRAWQQKGFGGRVGYGERPAVLVVDASVGFTSPDSPLGAPVDGVVEVIRRLLDQARAQHLPVVFTTVAYTTADQQTAAAFLRKVPALSVLAAGTNWTAIDPRLHPTPDEPVLVKLYASAFFGTPLLPFLLARQIDTLIVAGFTTSGCVRASVVDALQYGFRPIVPREAVGDRNPTAHEANLLDIDAKYGDVVPVADVLDYLRSRRTHSP